MGIGAQLGKAKMMKRGHVSFSKTIGRVLPMGWVLMAGFGLVGCSSTWDRLAHVGEEPELSRIKNPTAVNGYQPVTMPMPSPGLAERQPNSLWRAGSRTFFKDLRAGRVGDIVTVVIAINDSGNLSNGSTRSRTNSENDNITNLFGLQSTLPTTLKNQLPNLLNLDGKSNSSGTGTIARQEQINVRLAAIIIQVLPNGNLVLQGKQEMRVNYEVRDLQITGIIRPEDISPQNTVNYDSIAEARIAYGGRGQIADLQQPRYGNQIMDIILPF